MKKLVAVICMMIVLGTPICAGPSRKLDLYKIEESTWMYLNGEEAGVVNFVENGRSYVMLRNLGEKLGIEFEWDGVKKQVHFQDKGTKITLTIDSSRASVGGSQKTISAPARVKHGYTYLPLRAVAELLGLEVNYVDSNARGKIAKEMLFEHYPEWKARELGGKYYIDEDRYSVSKVEVEGYDPKENVFILHAYETIYDRDYGDHQVTWGRFDVNIEKDQIIDIVTGDYLR